MKPGIYHVQFKSSSRNFGEGLAVFKDGAVNGGDVGYLYVGTYEVSTENATAKLKVKKWNQAVTSVFGPSNNFDLDLKGTFQPDFSGFRVSGTSPNFPGATITIEGRRLSDAA